MKIHKNTIRFIKKLSLLLGIFSILVITNTSFIKAQESESLANSLPDPTQTCDPDEAADNWRIFISSIISYDSFAESWKDVFVRYFNNSCHYQDIDQIFLQLQKIQKQLESAINSCNNSVIGSLKTKYFDTELELIYLRNFVIFEDEEVFIVEKEIVFENVYLYLLEELSEEYILQKFTEFEEKYKKRVPQYKKCKDPQLQDLTNKFENLVNNIESMGAQIEKKAVNSWIKTVNTPPLNTGEFLINVVNKRLNQIIPKQTVLSTLNKLQTYQTNIEGQTDPRGNAESLTVEQVDIFTFTEAIKKEEETYLKTRTSVQLMAEYEGLYKNSGDAITNELEAAIDRINITITDTYPQIDSLKDCTKSVTDKQCQ